MLFFQTGSEVWTLPKVFKYVCVYMHVRMHVRIQFTCMRRPQVNVSVFPSRSPSYCARQGLSLNLESTDSARLAGPWDLESTRLCLARTWLQLMLTCLAFYVGVEIQTQDLTFVWKTLYPFSCLPNSFCLGSDTDYPGKDLALSFNFIS